MIEVSSQDELASQFNSNKAVIALFYATWCPFCRRFITVFDKYAKQPNSTMFMRVNMDDDDNPLWEEYDLAAVPSVILFENGNISKRLDCRLGAGLDEKQFSEWLQLL